MQRDIRLGIKMDLISGPSPCSSASPPISPIKLFSQPGAGLPPLKNMPVWNRTGLEKSRFIRSIAKDSPEIGKTELVFSHLASKSTQTTPPGTAVNNLEKYNNSFPQDRLRFEDNAAMVADKKLYFVQAEHEGVLKKLHLELDNLKNQNRDLTFKFVMTKSGISVSPDSKDARDSTVRQESSGKSRHHSPVRKQSMGKRADDRRSSFSKEEVRNRKSSYKSAGSKHSHATDDRNEGVKPGLRSAKHKQQEQRSQQHQQSTRIDSSQVENKSHDIVDEGTEEEFVRTSYDDTQQKNVPYKSPASALITGKDYLPEDYEEIIRNLKRLNAKQASELSHLKEKLIEQRGRHDDFHLPSPNHLPKLDIRNTSKSAKMPAVIHGKHQIVSLPALKPILGSKLTNRQRKAQASHVQRQRSNKDIAQKLV